ncbi:YlmH family RNA-binding protein [Clostridium lacusfryxellense]|uniref:YlmH family RNA-binding protein n=1 Tax=Clostridium lacusfryxellense TaxID=205328 RepID=UPI001C0CA2AD|nr:YlmH/Sll1252 family protein [Clostridium lacusfryxellense]MBU3111827.1 RNA-binding protein [Clostridium lacusfryxellense]
MDKNYFINSIGCEDKNLISNIFDKMQIAEKSNKIIFTNSFLPPDVWNQISVICESSLIKLYTNGLFKHADRRMLSFSTYDEPDLYPIDLLKISNKSKFSKVDHKDYLGSIMSLGIKREKLGDLIIKDEICYAPVCSDISSYIINNLSKIRNCPCEVSFHDYTLQELPERQFQEKIIISTSFRLDGMVSAICNVSRSNSTQLISSGKILVNYFQCLKKDKVIQNDDILTIRGYGKFMVADIIGSTQKGRFKVVIKQYI